MSICEIARPTLSDAEALSCFFTRSLQASFSDFPAPAHRYYQAPWSPQTLEKRLENAADFICIAKHNGHIVGLVSGTSPEGGVATVIWLFVDAAMQGQGIGRALFDAACSHYHASGAHKLKLTAPSESACAFYERMGMQREGFHAAHWWGMDFWSLGIAL